MDVLQKLVDAGNTVVVIEHNLDVIKTADYIIDLGPEGGDGGGTTGRLPARRRRLHSARVRIPDSISDRSSHAKTAENGINKVEMCNKTGVS